MPRYKVLTAGRVMEAVPVTVSSTESVSVALSRMREGGASAAFVVGAGREYIGTLEIGDAQSADSGASSGSTARRRPSVGPPETLLDDLIPHAAATDTPVAVVDDGNRLLGAVDRSAVMHALESRSA